MKGFKVLEADLKESKTKLAISEETVQAARTAYTELASEAQTAVTERDQVQRHLCGESLLSTLDRKLEPSARVRKKFNRCDSTSGRKTFVDRLQEITALREQVEANRNTLFDREEVRHYSCANCLWG